MAQDSKRKSGDSYQKSVWRVVKQIPRGRVATYGMIAEIIQKSKGKSQNYNSKVKIMARAVGNALHQNGDPRIPCHRVVDRNGRLAPNFAFDGWREQRKRLLAEGVKFGDEMHVDLEKSLWRA